MAKLSIIVPVYQVKQYLERCINSLLSQSFSDYEIVLVDDGSTDGSQDLCDVFADQYHNITVIHKPNGGLSSARNAGIELTTSEYIMFVDADDLIHANSVKLEMKALEEYGADALICSFRRFKEEDEIVSQTALESIDGISLLFGPEVGKNFFNNPNTARFVSSCGKVFKRKLFDHIRFPEGRLFEDEFIIHRLYYECEKVIVTDSVLYYYFINPNGITQNLSIDKRFDEFDAQIERISFYDDKNDKELLHLALLEFLHSAQWVLKTCQEGKQKHDPKRGEAFQNQYALVLKRAEKEGIVSFKNNYDYYILAFPKKTNLLRIKRQALKVSGKMK